MSYLGVRQESISGQFDTTLKDALLYGNPPFYLCFM